MSPRALMIDVAAILALGCLGVTVAWLMRRTTNLAARNLYPPALLSLATLIAGAAVHTWTVVLIIAPVCALTGTAAVYARRLRLSDLGAGEELRAYELARRWIWQPAPARAAGERVYLRSQGELVHARAWPPSVPYASMSASKDPSLRLPLGDGQHIFACGATGSGKPAGPADGICTPDSKRIAVAERLEANGRVVALIHELAHALVAEDPGAPRLGYAQGELIAESVAFCCCQTVGLDTSANSIPYLTSWAEGASLDVLEQPAALTGRLADRIEHTLLDEEKDPQTGIGSDRVTQRG